MRRKTIQHGDAEDGAAIASMRPTRDASEDIGFGLVLGAERHASMRPTRDASEDLLRRDGDAAHCWASMRPTRDASEDADAGELPSVVRPVLQ